MKKCPSCNAQCEESAELCPVCGYSFVEGSASGDTPKRTMMGFPSLSAIPEDEEPEKQEDPMKQTLFGFPANEEEEQEAGAEESEDAEDEYEATHIIPADEFNFDEEPPPELSDDELRGTVAGRPAPEGEEDEAKTEVVPGTALFPGRELDPSDEEEEEPESESAPHRGTLLGMSLQEVEGLTDDSDDERTRGSRSTQFAIPAAQRSKRGEGGKELDETLKKTIRDSDVTPEEPAEDEGEFDDAPTQAWSPDSADLKEKFDPKGRKKLLEKIRKSRPSSRDTSKGIPAAKPESSSSSGEPDLSALKKLRPKRELVPTPPEFAEDERETQEHEKAKPKPPSDTPSSGVLRAGGKSPRGKESGKAPGGASSYMLGPGEAQQDGSPPRGTPIGQDPKPSPPPRPSVGDGLSDPEFATAETDIADGSLLREAGIVSDDLDGPTQEDVALEETLADRRMTDETLSRTPGAPSRELDGPTSSSEQQRSQPPRPGGPNQGGSGPQSLPQQPQQPQQPNQPAQQQQRPPTRSPQQAQTRQPHRQEAASDRFTPSQRTRRPNVYETFEGGPSSSPQNQQPEVKDPTKGIKQTARPGEDPLVRTIQSLFGGIAGAITLIVQIVVLMGGLPDGILSTIVIALALSMGIAAIIASLAPVSMQIRSLALFGIGGLIGVAFILGFVATVPSTFYVVALGALVAVMAAGFPIVARHLL